MPSVIGGRYGIGSKNFSPAQVKAVFDELKAKVPKQGFTVGIDDDVSHLSLAVDPGFSIEREDVVRAVFFGLGADGTVGANKNSVKIIAEDPAMYAQGYFVYDSHKSGAQTDLTPALRKAADPLALPDRVGQFHRLPHRELSWGASTCSGRPRRRHVLAQHPLRSRRGVGAPAARLAGTDPGQKLRFYVIDASKVARDAGLRGRINTVLQTCFFAISGVLPRGRGDRTHQAVDRGELRGQGRRCRAQELRGRRPGAGSPARSARPRRGDEQRRTPAGRPAARPGVRA